MSAKSNGAHPSPGEDVKQKFREALERKQAQGGRATASGGESSKVHDAHGPAKVQHMFRRKSG